MLILALLSLVFFMIHAAPGDPLDLYAEPELDDAQRELIRKRLGLDRPLTEQYLHWIGAVLSRGDLGASLRQHRPVKEILQEAIPNTLQLTVIAYLVHFLTAIGAGLFMARHRGEPIERAATVGGLAVYSLPSFWLGLMLILLFSRSLGWFPAGGMMSPDAEFLSWPRYLLDRLHRPAQRIAAGDYTAGAEFSVPAGWVGGHGGDLFLAGDGACHHRCHLGTGLPGHHGDHTPGGRHGGIGEPAGRSPLRVG
jgi:peptide/nickel transport system permease protein